MELDVQKLLTAAAMAFSTNDATAGKSKKTAIQTCRPELGEGDGPEKLSDYLHERVLRVLVGNRCR